MPDIEFSANGSTANGYLALPDSGPSHATVVLQEWWGLDSHIRGVCDRLAQEGFVALAPDLYHGETAESREEAQRLVMALSIEEAGKEMAGAVDFLAAHEQVSGKGVGTLGFCLGGGLAVWTASANPKVAATVTYYGLMRRGQPDLTKIRAPVLGHFGTQDQSISVEDARQLERGLRDAGVDVTFCFYEGAGHAFFNDTNRLGTYDQDAAELSWQRTTEFLHRHLA